MWQFSAIFVRETFKEDYCLRIVVARKFTALSASNIGRIRLLVMKNTSKPFYMFALCLIMTSSAESHLLYSKLSIYVLVDFIAYFLKFLPYIKHVLLIFKTRFAKNKQFSFVMSNFYFLTLQLTLFYELMVFYNSWKIFYVLHNTLFLDKQRSQR